MTVADQPPEWLAELRQAEQNATPGPWWGASKNKRKDGIGIVGVGQGEIAAPIAVLAGARQTIKTRQADTRLIAALRNNAAALIAAAEAVEKITALCEQARKVSPSPAMNLYLGDVEQALGREASNV